MAQDLQIYMMLRSSVPSGWGLSPIPISEIAAYCDIIGLAGYEARLLFLKRIKLIDRVYLDIREKQSGKKNDRTNK